MSEDVASNMIAEYVAEAARIIEEATSYFCLQHYAVEGLEALLAAGWELIPPLALQRALTQTWTCPTCGLVYDDEADMKTHAINHPRECDHPTDGVMWNPYNEAVQCHRCGAQIDGDDRG